MRFRLTETHYAHNTLLPADTEIGDDTPYPFFGLSMFMEPLDDEARKAIAARKPAEDPVIGVPPQELGPAKLTGNAQLTPAVKAMVK